ncbi:hypothetical protein DFH09DRAFT_1379415, partial [Mycena vulgaris]
MDLRTRTQAPHSPVRDYLLLPSGSQADSASVRRPALASRPDTGKQASSASCRQIDSNGPGQICPPPASRSLGLGKEIPHNAGRADSAPCWTRSGSTTKPPVRALAGKPAREAHQPAPATAVFARGSRTYVDRGERRNGPSERSAEPDGVTKTKDAYRAADGGYLADLVLVLPTTTPPALSQRLPCPEDEASVIYCPAAAPESGSGYAANVGRKPRSRLCAEPQPSPLLPLPPLPLSSMLESGPKEDKKNYGICFCRSFDCKAQTWLSKDGQVKQGKWYSRVSIAKHAKKDQELVAEKILPAPQAVSVPIEPVTPMPAIISTNANILEGEPSMYITHSHFFISLRVRMMSPRWTWMTSRKYLTVLILMMISYKLCCTS